MNIYTNISDIQEEYIPKEEKQYYIYVLENTPQQFIKVGITRDPKQRFTSLSGSNGGGNHLVKFAISPKTYLYVIEKTVLTHFGYDRIEDTEWINNTTFQEAVSYIDSLFYNDHYHFTNLARKHYEFSIKREKKMHFKTTYADLFTAPEESYLVHCISSDFALGAGIAKEFAKRGVRDVLREIYRPKWNNEGYCLFTDIIGFDGAYNLVTKEHYYDKPTYDTLKQALLSLKEQLPNHHITLSMPKIGCGLDKLEWEKVKEILFEIFYDADVSFVVYSQDEKDKVLPKPETFALLIAGSRSFDDYSILTKMVNKALAQHKEDNVIIVEGGASGADSLARRYANEHQIELKEMPADWDNHGKAAGFIRNKQMHEYIAEFSKRGCLCFWDGESRGTKQNFDLAKEYHTQLIVFHTKQNKVIMNEKNEEVQDLER